MLFRSRTAGRMPRPPSSSTDPVSPGTEVQRRRLICCGETVVILSDYLGAIATGGELDGRLSKRTVGGYAHSPRLTSRWRITSSHCLAFARSSLSLTSKSWPSTAAIGVMGLYHRTRQPAPTTRSTPWQRSASLRIWHISQLAPVALVDIEHDLTGSRSSR